MNIFDKFHFRAILRGCRFIMGENNKLRFRGLYIFPQFILLRNLNFMVRDNINLQIDWYQYYD
jgi:hypothetical protein